MLEYEKVWGEDGDLRGKKSQRSNEDPRLNSASIGGKMEKMSEPVLLRHCFEQTLVSWRLPSSLAFWVWEEKGPWVKFEGCR